MRRLFLWAFISLIAISAFADEFVPCFIDDDNPKIRYNFRYIHEDYTVGGEIAITSVAVNPDMKNQVDITPGEYAYSWGQLKIQEIDASAFKGCEKIRKITLPGTLRTVNNQAFENCKDLEEVTFLELDSGRLTLGSAVFNNCTNLTTVRFANKISSLGGLTFYGCTSLRRVYFGAELSKILNGTFEGCTSLETVTFNQNLSSIGSSTFNGCTNLKEVYFKGACPVASQDIYLGSPEGIITIAEGDATGWPTNDMQWMGRPFAFAGISICTPRPQDGVGLPVVLTTPREGLGYVVKYTIDGTAPSATNGIVYSDAFYVDSDVTVKAVGIRNGRVGPTVVRSFQGDVMVPTMHVIACSDGMQTIAFSNRTDNSTIYYSLDSDALNTAARCYTEPFNVTNHAAVRAFAVRDGARNSLSSSWNIADCPVEFDPNGGSGGGVRMCTSNASIGPLPDVSRDGYIFEGWFTDIDGGQEITSGTVISCPVTLYARWREPEAQLTIVKGVLTRVALNGASRVIIPDGVTKIGDSAFYCLWNLKSVVMPSSVKSIGVSAFDGCSGLSEVVIPDGVKEIKSWAFSGCTGLTSVRMESVTTIGEYAFYLCRGLTSVSLGLSNATIGSSVFSGCSNLTAFYADSGNIRYATEGGLLLSKNMKSLVWVPGGLTNVAIPYGVEIVGEYAFSRCTKLVSVDIPDTVTEIGASAFLAQRNLKSVIIPDSVKKIGSSAFYGCGGLSEVCLPSSVTSDSGGSIFDGCTNLQTAVVQDGVECIGDGWFSGCSNLTSITLPFSVKTIGAGVFMNCASLRNVTIPRGVTNIGWNAFRGCENLQSMTIPDSVTYIGGYAFQECENLAEVYLSEDYTGALDNIFPFGASLIRYKPSQTVYLDASGGSSSVDSVLVQYGAPYGSLPVPVKPGFVFQGWYLNGRLITPEVCVLELGASHTLVAQWDPMPQCEVMFDANGGTVAPSSKMVTCHAAYGPLPAPVYSGHMFDGWYTERQGGKRISDSTEVLVTETHTLYAHWTAIQYTVTFDANGGEASENIRNVEYGKLLGELPTPTRDDYDFVGWYTLVEGGVTVTAQTVVSEATTYYAHWRESACPAASVDFTIWNGVLTCVEPNGATDVMIPDGVMSIGSYAFARSSCCELTRVTIPDGVTSIGSYAFSGCSSLTNIMIPSSVTSVGDGVFNSCSSLTSVTISDGVTSIGSYAFSGCSSLTNIIIPSSVTSVGDGVFDSCSSLTSMKIPDGVIIIGSCAFSGCSSLTNVMMPSGVTSVGFGAFMSCSLLTSMKIPDGVMNIGDYAFLNCSSLCDVSINNAVTNIGEGAFEWCSSLKSVIIPWTVTSIGTRAFYGCVNLNEVYLSDDYTGALDNIFPFGASLIRYKPSQTVYLDASGGSSSVDSVLVQYGAPYGSLPVPVKPGFVFQGWYLNGRLITPEVCVLELGASHTLVAQWDPMPQCEVMFDANGGAVAPSSKMVTCHAAYGPLPAPVYSGHMFDGWYTERQGGKRISDSTEVLVTETHTLYAHWTAIQYTVTFDANGGECGTGSLVAYGEEPIGELPIPTRAEAVFLGWFMAVEDGEKVEASTIAAGSLTLYAHWLTEVAVPEISTGGGNAFCLDSCVVTISCATEGATIYYTEDGTTPKRSDDYLYSGPITITDTTTFKAVAVYGSLRSDYVTTTITKQFMTLEEAMGVGDGVMVSTDVVAPWRVALDERAKVGDAMAKSGAIGNRTNTWLSATVSGAGTMSFWCKTSCEHDEDGVFTWDRLMVYTNGLEIAGWRMDGETDWTLREVSFSGGENTVKWVYYKDKSGTEGEDCAWVDGVTWTPRTTGEMINVGGGVTVTVPGEWFDGHVEAIAAHGGDRAAYARSTAANGRKVWECYVVGLDPENATNDFRITSFPMKADGTPDLDAITFVPPQVQWNVQGATPVLKGKASLNGGGEWQTVTNENKAQLRFFRVEVVLP